MEPIDCPDGQMEEEYEVIVLLPRAEFEWSPSPTPEPVERVEKPKKKPKKEKPKKFKEPKRSNRKREFRDDRPSTSRSEEIVDYAQMPKRKNYKRVSCASCNQDIIPGKSALPDSSIYCSVSCIQTMVDRCKQCVKPNEKINFLDELGTLIQLPDFQTVYLSSLEEFLLRKPSFKPFVDFAKLFAPKETSSKAYDLELLAKKEDTIRANVRKTILDQLMVRSKKNKIGISRKATQEYAEQVESELFKLYKSAKHPKYKEWCADFFFQLTDDNNMFFKSVVTNVYSAKKLILMKKDEMVVPLEMPAAAPPPPPRPKPVPVRTAPTVVSTLDSILGDEDADTTSKHNSHEFDSRCKICVDKVRLKQTQIELMMKDREELLEDRRRRKDLGNRLMSRRADIEPSNSSERLNHKNGHAAASEHNMSERSYSPSKNYSPPSYFNNSSPRRSPPDRRNRSPLYSKKMSPIRRAPSPVRRNDLYTPPPGVSPDRVAVRRLSPVNSRRFNASDPWEKPDTRMSFDEMRRNLKTDVYSYPKSHYMTPGLLDGPVDVRPIEPERFSRSSRWGDASFDVSNNLQKGPSLHHQNSMQHSPPIQLSPDYRYPEHDTVRIPFSEHQFNQSGGDMSSHDLPPVERSPAVEVVSVWATRNPLIWTGSMTEEDSSHNNLITLKCSLKAIGNAGAFYLKSKIPELIKIKARVRNEPMWAFVNDIKTSRKFHLWLYLVVPAEEDFENYDRYYIDLKNSRRYAVLDLPKELGVKEAYMFRVEPNEGLPSMLSLIDGPGLPAAGNNVGRLCVLVIKYAEVRVPSHLDSPAINSTLAAPMSQSSSNQPMSQDIPEKKPQTIEEILAFVENAPNANALIKGVQEYLKTHSVTLEEKQKIQMMCSGKIEKHKKQSQSMQPSKSQTSLEEQSKTNDEEMNDNEATEGEPPLAVHHENDFDDRMEIVEPEDEDMDKNDKLESPFEAGEVRDSPMDVDHYPQLSNDSSSNPSAFILPPPPPPPNMGLTMPPPPPPPFTPLFDNNMHQHHADLEEGELDPPSPAMGQHNPHFTPGTAKRSRGGRHMNNHTPRPFQQQDHFGSSNQHFNPPTPRFMHQRPESYQVSHFGGSLPERFRVPHLSMMGGSGSSYFQGPPIVRQTGPPRMPMPPRGPPQPLFSFQPQHAPRRAPLPPQEEMFVHIRSNFNGRPTRPQRGMGDGPRPMTRGRGGGGRAIRFRGM